VSWPWPNGSRVYIEGPDRGGHRLWSTTGHIVSTGPQCSYALVQVEGERFFFEASVMKLLPPLDSGPTALDFWLDS
jgi:hypothetical protein